MWDRLLKLIMGSSPLGQALRAVIIYVAVLIVAYLVGLVNATAGIWLTLILLLASVGDMLKNSEASLRFLWKRLPSALATMLVALVLGQTLDYVFGLLFVVFLILRMVERYL